MIAYIALFAASLLAATIVPFSSEAILASLLAARPEERWPLIAVAALGNTLGSVVNWCLGRFALRWRNHRWFPVSAARLDRAARWYRQWGLWSLLFAWVPVIGDPLTVAAGLLRVRLGTFVLLVGCGKLARYVAVALGVAAFMA